ncbi:hypothetical protein [Massilia sp. DWR3-1-1]|uniref:hypothetical protein n=1 Tax=Massilia sp. DWR3-1-1 TaxID=2804559 RepID=UPI003CF80B42
MTIVASLKLHTPGLPQEVKDAVGVLIAYAHLNSDQHEHKMSVRDFRRLLLVPLATLDNHVVKLVLKMGRVSATVRIDDTSVKPKKLVLVGIFGVFERLVLTDWGVTFRVSSILWEGLEAECSNAAVSNGLAN